MAMPEQAAATVALEAGTGQRAHLAVGVLAVPVGSMGPGDMAPLAAGKRKAALDVSGKRDARTLAERARVKRLRRSAASARGKHTGEDLRSMGGLELHPDMTVPARDLVRATHRVPAGRWPSMPHTHQCRLCGKTGSCQSVASKLAPRLSWQVRQVAMSGHDCKVGDKYINFRAEADLMPNMAAQFEWNRHTARLRREWLDSSPM